MEEAAPYVPIDRSAAEHGVILGGVQGPIDEGSVRDERCKNAKK